MSIIFNTYIQNQRTLAVSSIAEKDKKRLANNVFPDIPIFFGQVIIGKCFLFRSGKNNLAKMNGSEFLKRKHDQPEPSAA